MTEVRQMMGWGDFGGFGFMGILWMLMMVAFWVMVAVGIALLIKALTSGDRQRTPYPPATGQVAGPAPPAAPRSDALRIVEERYARGEIDRDEFLQRRADLTS